MIKKQKCKYCGDDIIMMEHPDGNMYQLHAEKTHLVTDEYKYVEGYQIHREICRFWNSQTDEGVIVMDDERDDYVWVSSKNNKC